LAKKETTGDKPHQNNEEAHEKEQLNPGSSQQDDDTDGFFNEETDKPKKQRFQLTRRRGATAALFLTLTLGGGTIGFMQAPNMIVNHLREVLLGKISELQNDNSLRYRRKHYQKIGDMFTKDGRRAGKVAADMENNGYRFLFSKETGNLEKLVTPAGKELVGEEIGQHISDYMEVRHPIRTSRWKTKRMEAFYNRYKIARASPVARAPDAADAEDPDKAVNKAIAAEVTDDSPTSEARGGRQASEDESDQAKAEREAQEQLAKGDGSLDEIKQKLRDGTPLDDLTPDERKLAQVGSEIDDELLELLDNAYANGGRVGSKVLGGVKSIAGSGFVEVADKICTVKNRLAAITFASRVYRARALLRYTSVFIKASDSTRTGQVDPKLLRSLMGRVMARDANGNSLGASPGFAFAVKNKFSKSQNDAFKGSFGVDGKKVGLTKAMQDATDGIPGMSQRQCGVYQNPAFQIGVAVVEIGVGIFTGGSSKAATEGAEQAAKITVRQVLNQQLKNLLTKQAAKGFAKALTVELTFEAALVLLQLYTEKSMSLNFTGQEKGGELSNILVAGAGTLNKQRGLEAGMIPATPTSYAQAKTEYYARQQQENKNKSFFARYFDYNNTDSLTFNAMTYAVQTPTTPKEITTSVGEGIKTLATTVLSKPANLITSIAFATNQKVYAQITDEAETDTITINGTDLVTDPAGNQIPILPPEIENIDPIENLEYLTRAGEVDESTLEPKSEDFKEHYKNCVEALDTITPLEKGDQNSPRYDCLAKLSITQRYKAFLAWRDMLDNVDAALFPEEIGSSNQPSQTGAPTTTDVIAGDTSNLTCAAGEDAGIGDGYKEGQLYKIRLCKVQGITVNAQIAANVDNMLNTSRAAGVVLSGGGFRTMEGQIQARKNNNCPDIFNAPASSCDPDTARPGFSNHQMGLAIDFKNCSSRGTACHKWLANNAAQFGLKNLPSEPWHWSVDGK
jgi:hypothetical protein